MLLEEGSMLESEPELAQRDKVCPMHKPLYIALKYVNSKSVKGHSVLKSLRLVHSGQTGSTCPLYVLARLLVV